MENRKDIGKAFNKKLSALDKVPSEKIWGNIHEELEKKKKRRIGFFLFWSGAIGLFLLGTFGAYYLYNQNSDSKDFPHHNATDVTVVGGQKNSSNKDNLTNENNHNLENENVVNAEKSINNENSNNNEKASINEKSTENIESANKNNSKTTKVAIGKSTLKTNLKSIKKSNSFKKKSVLISRNKNSKWSKKSNKKSKHKKGKSAKKGTLLNQNLDVLKGTNSAIADNSSQKTSTVTKKETDTTFAKKPKEKTKTINMFPKDSIQKDSALVFKKFDVDVFVSPTYYNYFSKKSSLDSRLDSITKTIEIKFSYGIGLSYDLTEKISVRIGYSKTNLSFTTKNASINVANYDGIIYNANTSNQSIYSASNNAERMNITQKISYSEIPLEVSYKFYDKKIGLKGTVGFSYLYLNDNSITIKTSNGFSQEIGKTNDLSKTALSINIGAGIDYKIFKNTKIFIEPMFNYQIKAFTKSNYKPYYIGIHTGIRYSFNN